MKNMIRKQYDILVEASGGGGPQPTMQVQSPRFMRSLPEPTTWIGKLWRQFYDSIAACPTPRYVEITDPEEIAELMEHMPQN
jgi:hypothetical protein